MMHLWTAYLLILYINHIHPTGFSLRTHSLQHSLEDESLNKKDNSIAEPYKSDLDSILTQSEDSQPQQAQEPPSLISFEAIETPARIEVIRQPSPPPVLAEVQDLVPAVSPQVNEAGCKTDIPSSDSFVRAESPLQLHIVRVNYICLLSLMYFSFRLSFLGRQS